MAAWFDKKPRLTPRSQYPPEVLRGIHTMENDLRGEAVPVTSSEPLVAFEPTEATQGAPFYADPSILTPASNEQSSSEGVNIQLNSPFLVDTPSPDQPVPSTPPETENVLELNTSDQGNVAINQDEVALSPSGKPFDLKDWSRMHKRGLLGSLLGIVVLGALGGGVWWWLARTPMTEPVISEGTVEKPMPLPTPTPEPKPEAVHYVTTQPNLISFDTETVTAEAMKTEFLKIALSVKQDNLQGPVKFLIRDQNYNPLAFSRFAYLLGLGLTPEIIANLDEDFSLFFLLDGERVRTGLILTIKNSEPFLVALSRDEQSLPKALEPLFLDMTTAPKTGLTFRSGLYREQPVRYANIDQVANISIDSAVRGNEWLIGTSQNTLRALLDRP